MQNIPGLFDETKTKKQLLYEYISSQGRVSTSDVIRWGLDHYHIRADRDARELAEEGKIWRMSDRIKLCCPKFRNTKQDVWSVFEADK